MSLHLLRLRRWLMPLWLLAAMPGRAYAEDMSLVAEARGSLGAGDRADLGLALVGVGLRRPLSDTMDVHALALGLGTWGHLSAGSPARGGGGGELGLRLLPWPAGRVRPFAEAGLGLLLFPRQPFLPGGSFYEGLISFGVGLSWALSPTWTLAARGFTVHLSNGQGLGPHNPAYDGWGAALSLTRGAPATPAPLPSPAPPSSQTIVFAPLVGEGDGAFLTGARVNAAWQPVQHLGLVLDGGAGSLAGHAYGEIQAGVRGQQPWVAMAVAAGVRRFVGVNIALATAQAELHVTPRASLVGMGHHERSGAFGSLWRAGVGLRAFPLATLGVDLGVGFDRLGDAGVFGGDHADPYFAIEWLFHRGWPSWSLFLERQISRLNLVGLRIGPRVVGDLLQRDRVDGWRAVR